MSSARWDTCISHRDEEARKFIESFFASADRETLLICGAGFDPRATETARLLSSALGHRLTGHFIREDRPRPDRAMLAAADANEAALRSLIVNSNVHRIQILSDDEKTVIAGRRIVQMIRGFDLSSISDIVVDLSALSTGVSFPLVRHLFDRAEKDKQFPNLHIMVSTSTQVDDAVQNELMDRHQSVPGFGEALALADGVHRPKLWLPQLAKGALPALELIHSKFDFEEICPIVPFPAQGSRAVEELVEKFRVPITGLWAVDDRDFLYAAEDDPLDLYRTILRVEALRRATYEIEGGSLTVLSPLGTKAMALGALMAALERDLPIVYVEAQRYKMSYQSSGSPYGLIHLWLTGQAYP
jgi:hypothetical protein